jgi:hypothetical protein
MLRKVEILDGRIVADTGLGVRIDTGGPRAHHAQPPTFAPLTALGRLFGEEPS